MCVGNTVGKYKKKVASVSVVMALLCGEYLGVIARSITSRKNGMLVPHLARPPTAHTRVPSSVAIPGINWVKLVLHLVSGFLDSETSLL